MWPCECMAMNSKIVNNKKTRKSMKRIHKLGLIVLVMVLGAVSFNIFAAQNNQKTKAASTGTVVELSAEEFKKKVCDINNNEWAFLGDKPCILDFYASWCGPCKMLSPHLEKMAKKYNGKINIYKINVDKNRDLAAAFDARSIPLVVFIPKDGTPRANRGYMSEEELDKAIQNILLAK